MGYRKITLIVPERGQRPVRKRTGRCPLFVIAIYEKVTNLTDNKVYCITKTKYFKTKLLTHKNLL
jgi:hypothetical protein